MAKEITYEKFLKELDKLPNVVRSITVNDNKRELAKRRSTFFGGGRRNK